MKVRCFAPAKINLTLQVARPRADGMHELQSAVVFADIGDWVEAELQPDAPFHVTGPFSRALMETSDNLVLAAAAAIDRTSTERVGTALTLEKNLPIASGVGGGSSDAAATLKAFNALWNMKLTDAELMRIGAKLGADVPVCVAARSAWMTGVGDTIEPLATPALHAVLLNPGKPLATAAVFKQFDLMGLGSNFTQIVPPQWRTTDEAVAGIAALGNDLEAPAIALMPEIGEIAASLRADRRVAYAGLSGSGATLFAITETPDLANALAAEFSTRSCDWWVRPVTLGSLDAAALRG